MIRWRTYMQTLFSKSSLNRITDTTLLPYSLILANKVIRANKMEAISTIKGAFQNNGLLHPVRKTAQTLFSPNSKNKTTSVAQVSIDTNKPNYLIKSIINEVIRLMMGGVAFSTTEVVLSKKLGRNEVHIFENPLFPKSSLNRVLETFLPFPYSLIFYYNKGIREDRKGVVLLLRALQKIRV